MINALREIAALANAHAPAYAGEIATKAIEIARRALDDAITSARFEMDGDGRFRIVHGDRVGEAVVYQHVATLPLTDGTILAAVSEYYSGSDLEPERVYILTPIATATSYDGGAQFEM